jgi:hypothetical protein
MANSPPGEIRGHFWTFCPPDAGKKPCFRGGREFDCHNTLIIKNLQLTPISPLAGQKSVARSSPRAKPSDVKPFYGNSGVVTRTTY